MWLRSTLLYSFHKALERSQSEPPWHGMQWSSSVRFASKSACSLAELDLVVRVNSSCWRRVWRRSSPWHPPLSFIILLSCHLHIHLTVKWTALSFWCEWPSPVKAIHTLSLRSAQLNLSHLSCAVELRDSCCSLIYIFLSGEWWFFASLHLPVVRVFYASRAWPIQSMKRC